MKASKKVSATLPPTGTPSPATASTRPPRPPPAVEQPSPSKFSMEVTLDFDAGPGSIPTATIVPNNESKSSTLNVTLQPRNLKSPSELGVLTEAPEPSPKRKDAIINAKILRSENSAGWQRTLKAIQSMKSPAAALAAAASNSVLEGEPTMICSVAHRGQEMLFCALKQKIVGVCARTRVTLQYLTIPDDTRVVMLSANPATAQILVGLSNGLVQTYHPVPTSPRLSSPLSSAYVRHRWINGPVVDCRAIFVGLEQEGFEKVHISSSVDYKLLVGHRDQLAVFLVKPTKGRAIDANAEVMWTTRLEQSISSARISGDGQAIVYVLEGEQFTSDSPFGARTYLRDFEDGALISSTAVLERAMSNASIGVVYKPGPFLVHSSHVTQISFRGFGHITSSATPDEDEGNDLLLTYCDQDSTVRVFSQNSWKKLVQWTTPPQTRVDWVRGISAFNLGDLEPRKNIKKSSTSSQPTSRRPSLELAAPGVNRSFPQSAPTHPAPSTSAGAWIAEITFRSAYPALRLSRLSYLKRGSEEAQAAHFESVSAILPAGSIIADRVIGMGEMGMSVQGIWPAWHPWASEGIDSKMDGTLSGSAMSFLGLSAGNIAANGFFGDNNQGGKHSPPSELRVIASHPHSGKVVLMEFPLWGDQDFGAMELGSPLRYLLSLTNEFDSKHSVFCLDYESSKLFAQIDSKSKAVDITWRKQGTHLLLPESNGKNNESDLTEQHQTYRDLSVVPLPLSLPSLRLPPSVGRKDDEKIAAIQWWPDENYGGPPQLLCVCSSGTVLVYEMPPPWSALEPVMPGYDPINELSGNVSVAGEEPDPIGDDEESQDFERLTEYEVMVTPHPEFGIGLRLEAQMDGMPAIAGSYKMHPLSGGQLPAEKTGMIVLGDELLSVNGVTLEGISFDDIINSVRQVGADAAPGAPLCMRFRPVLANRRRINSTAFSSAENSEQGSRRTREQILGISPIKTTVRKKGTPQTLHAGTDTDRTVVVDANGDVQQEFARIIATIPGALGESPVDDDLESIVVLMPWLYPSNAPDDVRGAALLIVARGKVLHAKRVEVAADCSPSKARCVHLGSVEMGAVITKVQTVESKAEDWCISVCDDKNRHRLVFIRLVDPDTLKLTIQHFPMVSMKGSSCMLRSFSPVLFGTTDGQSSQRVRSVVIWSALPDPKSVESLDATSKNEKEQNSHRYCKSVLSLEKPLDDEDEIVDFRFISSGSLDSYPWIVLFTKKAAIVHTRPGGKQHWSPKLTITYPIVPTSNPKSQVGCEIRHISPADSHPHLVSAISNVIDYSDEIRYIRSDWHPDSLLSYVCTDKNGPMFALLRNVKGIFEWLAKWTHQDRASYPTFCHTSRLCVTPFAYLNCQDLLSPYQTMDSDSEAFGSNNAASLFASLTAKPIQKEESPERRAMIELQNVLCPKRPASGVGCTSESSAHVTDSQEQVVYDLPPPLRNLSTDEIRLLWAIGELLAHPPDFKTFDAPAQHALFCLSLLRQVMVAPNEEQEEDTINHSAIQTTVLPSNQGNHHMSRRQDFMMENNDSKSQNPVIAAAGGLAALVSSKQKALIEKCRPVGGQIDWDIARSLRMPFWVRSNEDLRKISEEIGKAVFLKTKDIMECAFFFIIAGNMRTLKNLSLTDQTENGRRFANFLTGYDFSTSHGRKAAEKNAYSLLRKNRYNVAASFFLLAQPPMLQTAIEIIISKSGDFDLAFMATRLIEAPPLSPFGTGLSLGAMGGGGGYGSSTTTDTLIDDVFDDWIPKLGKASKGLLRDRGLELAKEDPCFRAIQLMWLARKEEAARELAEMDAADTAFPQSFDKPIKNVSETKQSQLVSFPFHAPVKMTSESANDRVLKKANKIVDFVSRPFLLHAMKSSVRSRWASTLLVSHALSRRGIELPSVRCLLHNTNQDDLDNDDPTEATGKTSSISTGTGSAMQSLASGTFDRSSKSTQNVNSSIFDSFNAAPQRVTDQIPSSSIFDSFDTPRPFAKQHINSYAGNMSSSIFDNFDAAPPKPKPADHAGQVVSSIFDGFDGPPPKPKLPTGQTSSSIFDSFDAAPPKSKPQVAPQTNHAISSIFDSFDTPGTTTSKPFEKVPSSTVGPLAPKAPDNDIKEDYTDDNELPSLRTPSIWIEWRNCILSEAVARRLIREVGRFVDHINADIVQPPMHRFSAIGFPLIPSYAAEALRTPCEAEGLLAKISGCVHDLCKAGGLETSEVIEKAIRILDSVAPPRRIVLVTLLHIVIGRADLAEDVIRDAAIGQILRCDAFALNYDDLVDDGATAHHKSSLHLRRVAIHVSWQLELCLWLHRGGGLPLSSTVLKEAIVAVRVGFVLVSWGRNHECIDALVRNVPDCPLDHNGGRQLWSSMKLIAGLEDKTKKIGTQGSGGWEFLVDCRREEATAMLRKRTSGSFIIRPHQDDNGVFTLSFKTNLTPAAETDDTSLEVSDQPPAGNSKPPVVKPVKKNDVVQHAIIRLSDAGFRCGSFGPFTTLMKLLEAVSASLPFDLLFDKPPTEGIIKDDEYQPSPNLVFLRKLAMTSLSDHNPWHTTTDPAAKTNVNSRFSEDAEEDKHYDDRSQLKRFGFFSQLLTLSEIRKQICAVAAADYEDLIEAESSWNGGSVMETESVDSFSADEPGILGVEERYALASRLVRPFLVWCHAMEVQAIHAIAPDMKEISQETQEQCALAFTESSIELVPHEESSVLDGGDAMIRRMIQPNSGVEFRTLRVGEGGDSAMIILFSKSDAMSWVKDSGMEKNDKDALSRLARMEERRVIEPIALSDLSLKAFSHNHSHEPGEDVTCYRFVDPWEVEALGSREGETKAAALGREHYLAFSVNSVANSCEAILRKLGGLHLLSSWSSEKGGLRLTKAIASVHPPWERDAGGDLQMTQGMTNEPSAFQNAIRQHLYRNTLFRRLEMPQRFLALVQVELLDLKNLSAPGGASLSVFALLRLKRQGSSAPLTHKARTLDSAATQPMKIGKSSGPNAPASWGSLVRFRFPLPEDVNCDGTSFNEDREALFKGPPCILQVSVYEKKFMSDITLGGADVKLDALANGGQMEEWVPLRSPKHGVNWFARMRLTLRFELMCLPSDNDEELPSSVGLTKIQKLSKTGGTHEDKVKKSASTPDILSYFESMVY